MFRALHGQAWRVNGLRLAGYPLLGLAVLVVVNGCYQIARKPTELLGLVAPSAAKSPRATWAAYGALFREHATDAVRPAFLAALVQAESQGDPLARTYWRWRWSWNPFELYAPASSAVGILQITDGTFDQARRFCVHDHRVVREGAWYERDACWFTALYSRPVPSHAIEMTSAWLSHVVTDTLPERPGVRVTRAERERLAAVVHLCGQARGTAVARRGLRIEAGERCGDHDLHGYLARVRRLTETFAALDAG